MFQFSKNVKCKLTECSWKKLLLFYCVSGNRSILWLLCGLSNIHKAFYRKKDHKWANKTKEEAPALNASTLRVNTDIYCILTLLPRFQCYPVRKPPNSILLTLPTQSSRLSALRLKPTVLFQVNRIHSTVLVLGPRAIFKHHLLQHTQFIHTHVYYVLGCTRNRDTL